MLASETGAPERLGALVEALIGELGRRWSQGEPLRSEVLLARHPVLLEQPETAIDLLYEEICLAEQAGAQNVWGEMRQRFPQWETQLQSLFDCHRLLQPGQPGPSFPECGELIGEFRLLKELGRGARGRVYLAAQPALGNRPVVLKLTPRDGREHLSLARLQHTNIVPLYAARDDRARQLRLLCMPYLGNASLSQVLARLAAIPCPRRTGQDLVAVLDRLQAETPVPLAPGVGPKRFLARASYVEAICWIGACCADALQYAHERGLVHLDVKPSNVLVAADGQPMLLDYHLAHEPLWSGKPPPEELGGTSAYMPPEQQAAIDAVGEGRPISVAVAGGADIYSLGAVLYEALGGPIPFVPNQSPPLHLLNPQVSVGLSDILAKCLAAAPAQRYADAAALAVDLRCHLTHQPLKGVANRSLAERWRKYRKRRPTALRRTLLTLLLLATTAALLVLPWVYLSERLHEAERALHLGQQQHKQHAYGEALESCRYGLARVDGVPFGAELARQLREQIHLSEDARARTGREQLAHQWHTQAKDLGIWVNYFYGLCAYRLQRYEDAALAFSVCIGAAPDRAECYYNRALALAGLGRTALAIHDYDQALQLDRTLASAYLNRGMLYYQEKHFEQALADLDQALIRDANPALVYYDRALVHLAARDPASALNCLTRALQYDPHHVEAARLRDQLQRTPRAGNR